MVSVNHGLSFLSHEFNLTYLDTSVNLLRIGLNDVFCKISETTWQLIFFFFFLLHIINFDSSTAWFSSIFSELLSQFHNLENLVFKLPAQAKNIQKPFYC